MKLYTLGVHRLLCGDSTVKENVEMLMQGGQYADMVFTDPPYKMGLPKNPDDTNYQNLKRFHKTTASIMSMSDFKPEPFLEVLPTVFNGCMNAYIFCSKDLLPTYLNYAINKKYTFNVLVWCKKSGKPIGNTHWTNLEYIVHLRKSAIWNNGLEWVNYSKYLMNERVKRTAAIGNHPTPKPVDLIANEIQISSHENGIVVDLFGGSGSTLIAAEQTNRRCFMMEIDPFYCDVISKRWERFTGGSAEISEL